MLTPGNRPDRLAKSIALDIDAAVFDLEDGVAPDDKPAAREIVNRQLADLDFGHRERLVRVNAIGTDEFAADMQHLAFDRIDGLFIPKVETAHQLEQLDDTLTGIEMMLARTEKIDVVATLETPRGILNALAIADASDRTSALFFGSGDYAAATGSAVTAEALAFPRATLVAAAAAAGLQAIDAAYFTAVKDAAATTRDAEVAKELGFDGKVIFHPNQIAPCNSAFSPTPEEVQYAEKIVAAYENARAKGQGTAYVDGAFIAIDIAMMAKRTLARARQVAARQSTQTITQDD